MPQALTDLERRALDYIVDYLRQNTYQPSIREIGRRFGLKSTKTVSELLHSIEEKGYIERDPSRSRGVRLLGVSLNGQTVSVPVYEAAAPGAEPNDRIEIDRRIAGPAGSYFMRVSGRDLDVDGLRDGDLLLVDPAASSRVAGSDLVVTGEDGLTTVHHAAVVSAAQNRQGRVIAVLRLVGAPAGLEATATAGSSAALRRVCWRMVVHGSNRPAPKTSGGCSALWNRPGPRCSSTRSLSAPCSCRGIASWPKPTT
jgi:repressor LexA